MTNSRMPVVYIAGPFRGPTTWHIAQNVRRAEAVSLEVWKLGAAALCPHANTSLFQGQAPDEVWIEGTLELMRRCDAVILVEGWQKSSGTRGEIQEAEALGIPVFHDIDPARALDDLKGWLDQWRK